jgi:type II secretory pathway pseudopilin PulG
MANTELARKKRFWTPYGVLAMLLVLVLLVAASLPGSGPLKAGIRVAVLNQVSQIYTACQNYQIEYGTLPETSENYRLKKILCGDNPRKIEFLSLKTGQINPNGEIIDPWGTPFRITFDSDSKVHVISADPDKIFGTADDITNQ